MSSGQFREIKLFCDTHFSCKMTDFFKCLHGIDTVDDEEYFAFTEPKLFHRLEFFLSRCIQDIQSDLLSIDTEDFGIFLFDGRIVYLLEFFLIQNHKQIELESVMIA